MDRWQSTCECQFCHRQRGMGDFYCYADHIHGIGNKPDSATHADWRTGPDAVRICHVCLYRHLSRHYPSSPGHQSVGSHLTEQEREELLQSEQMALEMDG